MIILLNPCQKSEKNQYFVKVDTQFKLNTVINYVTVGSALSWSIENSHLALSFFYF